MLGLMRPALPVTILSMGTPVLDENGDQDYYEDGSPKYEGAGERHALAIRIRPVRGQERSVGQQLVTVDYTASFPPDSEIRVTDELSFYADGGVIAGDVVSVYPVFCPRMQRVKHILVDLRVQERE